MLLFQRFLETHNSLHRIYKSNSKGVFTSTEIQPVSEIWTDIILYSRIEFWCKWVCHLLSLKNGPNLIINQKIISVWILG